MSETGATTDPVIAGQPLAWWVLEVCKAWHDERDFSAILRAIYEAGERSAHLEDARAILALGMRPCPDKGHDDRWCHYCVTRGDALDEAQQVVEDALSRTGAK